MASWPIASVYGSKGMGMGDEMVTEEILASVELYNLQSLKLTAKEKRKLEEMVERNMRSRDGVRVLVKSNAKRDTLLKRKVKSLNENRRALPRIDGYVAPLIPQVRGLFGLIEECSRPIEKQLTETDLKDQQSRLSLSKHDAEEFLLPLLEGKNLKVGVPTIVYDMEGNSFSMTFKFWSDKYYVLTSGWNEFYRYHDLRPVEDFVTVWMFRHGETKKTCFALSSRRLNVTHRIKKIRKS